ncbi:hypothetical protein AK812_SmicGene23906 [Symbiodinium microadriaticum]|uniref:CCHC-type domain-containing protein n=1 Tax=Symbiodinium microadriaticum TaxID=2951 RepID=A0A1Q9DFZ8_SYMMI|nr:hypothetical protein AK812_SmicGene23906 [Symbiodinium microadriaticum]
MSGTADVNASAIGRTKDGIPTWGGEASSFVQYEEAALLWEQSLTWEKRYTAGPKLVQELTGAARRLVSGQPAGWVAFRGGVTTLMDHLRKALGKPRVNEVTDLLATYFKGTKRRAQESMNDYVTRKTEAYMRASQALKRVQPHYERGAQPHSQGDDQPRPRRGSDDNSSWGWSRQWTPANEADEPSGGVEETTEASTEASTTAAATGTSEHPWTTTWWSSWDTRPQQAWGSQWGYQWNQWNNHWDRGSWGSSSTTSRSYDGAATVELLPQFIQGWYLLVDANLDSNERNLVMTALGGNFDPLCVAQELRNQFSESDVRRRDGARRFQSYIGDTLDDDDTAEHHLDETAEDILTEGMSEEGIALVVDAEEVAQEAMASLHQAKRTLKEARQRQHQVRQNRKYYQGANHTGRGSSSTSSSRPRDDSQIECLRCGVKGHRVAQCPHKPLKETQGQGNLADTSSADKQQAPFVCYTNSVAGYVSETDQPAALSASPVSEGLTTAEAVKLGMAVVDGGATQTIGSATAIEAVMKGNAAKRGSSGLRGIDTRDPPVFSFGNSTENRCLSTAKLQVYAGGTQGEMTIHTLEDGESPILMSIDTLRKVGALIDFQADLAVFRNIDPSRILKLERSRTGHQLLPLTENLEGFLYLLLVTNMEKLTQPQMVLSLRAYGEEAPKTWTRVQLMARLKELEAQGEVTAPTTKKMKTPLEEAVKELNRAAARKATLQKYVQEGCGLTITGNETISVLQQKAMTHLLATVEASAKDPLGFGKYSTQSYEHEDQRSSLLRVGHPDGEGGPVLGLPEETGKTKIDIGAIVEQAKR